MIRIYADFNNIDEHYQVLLNTAGSINDIRTCVDALQDGMQVVLYMTGEFEVVSTLLKEAGIWKGQPHWDTIRYYDERTKN